MPKSPEEVLRSIEDSELDDERERVAAMTPEQRRAELEAGGVDVAEVHAKADALHERVRGQAVQEQRKALEKEGRTASLRPRPGRRAMPRSLQIGALAAVVVVGVAVYVALGVGTVAQNDGVPSASTSGGPRVPEDVLAAARELRQRAYAACRGSQWDECLRDFDDARKLDPAGDRAAQVQIARQQATRAIEGRRVTGPEGTEKPKP